MDNAAFKLDTYYFEKASLNFDIPNDAKLNIDIIPSGIYAQENGIYTLRFEVKVICNETDSEVVNVLCKAQFSFGSPIQIEDIPEFFYPNSLAIIFPYVRAFVSTITLQANVRPVILPTVNLMSLTEILRSKTEVK